MSIRARKCPTCGGRNTQVASPTCRDRDLMQCLDALTAHPEGPEAFPYFDRNGPVALADGLRRIANHATKEP